MPTVAFLLLVAVVYLSGFDHLLRTLGSSSRRVSSLFVRPPIVRSLPLSAMLRLCTRRYVLRATHTIKCLRCLWHQHVAMLPAVTSLPVLQADTSLPMLHRCCIVSESDMWRTRQLASASYRCDYEMRAIWSEINPTESPPDLQFWGIKIGCRLLISQLMLQAFSSSVSSVVSSCFSSMLSLQPFFSTANASCLVKLFTVVHIQRFWPFLGHAQREMTMSRLLRCF